MIKKFLVRTAAVAVVAAAAAVLPTTATADTSTLENTVGVLDADGPSGCNRSVCIYSEYTGSGWRVWGEFRTHVARGHIDFWGPNGFKASSPDGPWAPGGDTQKWSGSGSGGLCAQGWAFVNGRWNSLGLPCVTI